MTIEDLADRFNTVGAFYHDAYCRWQVVVDGTRCVWDGCRFTGWGDTLDDAVRDVLAVVGSQQAARADQQPSKPEPYRNKR